MQELNNGNLNVKKIEVCWKKNMVHDGMKELKIHRKKFVMADQTTSTVRLLDISWRLLAAEVFQILKVATYTFEG